MATQQKNLCTVEVKRHFTQAPEAVFDAWLNPDSARQWLFATPGGQIVQCDINPRVGGKFTVTDRRKNDEGELLNIEHAGEYLDIDRPRRIVFTFGVPMLSEEFSRVTLDFVPQNGGCDVSLFHEGVWPDYVKSTRDGWNGILDGLTRVLNS